jgi:hypothetical protein
LQLQGGASWRAWRLLVVGKFQTFKNSAARCSVAVLDFHCFTRENCFIGSWFYCLRIKMIRIYF